MLDKIAFAIVVICQIILDMTMVAFLVTLFWKLIINH
jgi:hypothetical protein